MMETFFFAIQVLLHLSYKPMIFETLMKAIDLLLPTDVRL